MPKKLLAKKGIKKLASLVMGRSKRPTTYGGSVESSGAAQKLSKGLPRNKNRRKEIQDIIGDGNPISRMDDSARRAFARRNIK